jgi:uncharacterized protein YdgA (DUF945 family)
MEVAINKKRHMKIKNFIILINFFILISYNIECISTEVNLTKTNEDKLMELYNSKEIIKLNFYHWDRETNQKKEYIGWAELNKGKLTYDVKDKRLEKMLKGNFHTMITVEENGKQINKFVTYKVGTIEHLISVIEHCKDISCVAERVSK